MIMLLIALSSLVSYGMTWGDDTPDSLLLLRISENPYVITGLIVLMLLVLGMFIDSTVLILLLTSILVPVMKQIGMDLVHFGV